MTSVLFPWHNAGLFVSGFEVLLLHLQHEQRQTITQRIDPRLIVANSILQLSSMELVQLIESELLENPALETSDGESTDPEVGLDRAPRSAQEVDGAAAEGAGMESGYDFAYGPDGGDDEFDRMGNIEAEITLQEHLRCLYRAAVPSEQYAIGEYLIHSLDGRGWLDGALQTIAAEICVPLEAAERALAVIQSFDPPGIGARHLQECLLIQLKYLREESGAAGPGAVHMLAERLVRDFFEHVGARRYAKLAREAQISAEAARSALEYIRACCNPFPASQFRPPWNSGPTTDRAAIRPDVLVIRTEFGYDIDVPSIDMASLSVNEMYRKAYNQIKSGVGSHTERDKRHIAEYVDRAELFLKNLEQRKHTLRLITRCIVDAQIGFLETGSPQFLRPLTRTRVARTLGIHESTVSRATSNKYVQLPNLEVVGFHIFFNSSLSVKDAISEVIQEEDTARPLSDQQIVEKLNEKGITVARRTIVKYREARKIPSSMSRRR